LSLALFAGVALLVTRASVPCASAFHVGRRARAVHDAGWLSLVQRLANGMGIARPVTLLRSDRACVPMTWGVVYPRVLLPADADAWTADRRTIVLLHELAHVKRLDAFTQFVAQVSVAAFWFNPIVWFAARRCGSSANTPATTSCSMPARARVTMRRTCSKSRGRW
jgi:beta-lactamase regulating signal transducer with metallopeptidase domain